jgi:hypothetical protein
LIGRRTRKRKVRSGNRGLVWISPDRVDPRAAAAEIGLLKPHDRGRGPRVEETTDTVRRRILARHMGGNEANRLLRGYRHFERGKAKTP